MKQKKWIVFSGLLWVAPGISLLNKGLRLITQGMESRESMSWKLLPWVGSQQDAATLLMATGLMIGFLKGRFILAKTVNRFVSRILHLPSPIRFFDVYKLSYFFLIGAMMMMGFILRTASLPLDFIGWVDVAIGSALIQGAILYFRAARNLSLSAD